MLLALILAKRTRTAHRFEGFGASRRVLALGVMLAGLAGIPVLDFTIYGINGSYFLGMGSLFAGFLQVLLILKIASSEVYPDWVVLGVLDISMGALLLVDPSLIGEWSLLAFCACFAVSALVRIWMGVIFRDANAFTFIGASGLAGLFLLAWFLLAVFSSPDISLDLPVAADLVLRADLALRGAAIMGFGVSLGHRED